MDKSFTWIKSCIDSCNDMFQLECCNILIELFDKKFGHEGWHLSQELITHWMGKEAMIVIN